MNLTLRIVSLFLISLSAFVQPQKDAGKSQATAPSASTANRAPVEARDAPKPIGPYSQAIKAGDFVFCAGQIALDPATGQLIQGDVSAQADRVLKNLSAVLAAAGTDLDHAVKTTIYLKNISDFTAVNEVYGRYFKSSPPARSTVGVAALPRDALIEIDIVATMPAK
jgi:2-iminobutanoate/2-iminopropanoate deaminase